MTNPTTPCWCCSLPPIFLPEGETLRFSDLCTSCHAYLVKPRITTVSLEQSRADRDQRGPGSAPP